MIVFVNPKFNLPKWLKYIVLTLAGIMFFLGCFMLILEMIDCFIPIFE